MTTTRSKQNCITDDAPSTMSINNDNSGWGQVHVFFGDSKKLLKPRQWTSQANQDTTVWLLLNKKVGGYFVDLAANDAVHFSNTYTLETFYSWKGLCIEANPHYWHRLAARPYCHVVGAVVGSESMQLIDFHFNGLFGGIVNEKFDNKNQTLMTESRYTVTLEDVFFKFKVPSVIDYLSLDVEGAESYVLKGFPFEQYTIKVMTIERPKDDLKQVLREKGYVFLRTISRFGEALYCHKSVVSELDFKSARIAPPNIS